MGLGGPMNWWDPELCTMLAEAGFHVVRFDNRDTGRSTRRAGPGHPRASWCSPSSAAAGGRRTRSSDMAGDAFGLMDHLGWDSAHVVGVSMGGMIVQTMAIDAARAGPVADLDHVHARQAHASAGSTRRCCRMLIGTRAAGREAYVATSREDVAADRLARLPARRGEGAAPGPRRPSTAASRPAA